MYSFIVTYTLFNAASTHTQFCLAADIHSRALTAVHMAVCQVYLACVHAYNAFLLMLLK